MTLSAAISKYIYVAINHTFTDDYLLKYAQLERVNNIEDIEHPIIREALRLADPGHGIEIVSVADIPAGTGLGSSGSFTVGLLHALHAYRRDHVMPEIIASEACRIEIEVLGRPVGKQDQYAAAYGGITCFEFEPDGRVRATPLMISTEILHHLEEHLILFFMGLSRDADAVLDDQDRRSK
jgi:D-glycero-alpha-D-manno-heptose-7-phosphate kinase